MSASRPHHEKPEVDTEQFDLGDAAEPAPQKLAVSRHGMVSSAHYAATEAGVEMLRLGGTAVDAAVATAFALGVCEPAASGLGGQTMMLIYNAKKRKTVALDGSSRAPHRAIPGTLSAEDIRRGYKATTVPSTPAVLDYALRRYGSFELARVIRPAADLAAHGVRVTPLQHRLTRRERKALRQYNAGGVFLKDGKTPSPGTLVQQAALASTLRRIGRLGIETFYKGKIARAIHADMVQNGGLLRRDDLAQVPWPIERRPLATDFDGARIMTMPPPGAGRTLIQMLNILAHFPKKLRQPPMTPERAVLLASVIQRAYLDRRDRPFDPNYYAQVGVKRMLSDEYARSCARDIKKRIQTRGETTHLSVMDRHGNVVALTQSIERVYGACVMTPELGFLYNNYLMAFEHEDIAHPYYLRPNAVPWASVAPTIALKNGEPWLAIGSPGSERIAPAIVQVLMRLGRQAPLDAVDAPRLYCNFEGQVSLEAARMRGDIPEALERHGFTVDRRDPYSFYLGCIALVMRDGRDIVGVADPRRDGAAAGPRA